MENNNKENAIQATDNKIAIYQNASLLKIEETEQKKLTASFDEKLIEIRPDGIIYLPQVFWRIRLNETFGIGQWCLIPKSQNKDPEKDKLYIEGVLMVRGAYMATAVGEAELHSDNKNQSWASVWESAKSDCITRCCKDLGIAAELWQPEFIRQWLKKYAVDVWCQQKDGKYKKQWRKASSDPFWNEQKNGQEKQEVKKLGKPEPKPIDELELEHWSQSIKECNNINELLDLYNKNKGAVNSEPKVFEMFTTRKKQLQSPKKVTVNG